MTSRGRAYLDWNASAPLRPQARAAMVAALDTFGNPSSIHAEGRAARAICEDAREAVAALVGVAPGSVVFTSGATEANNWVLAGGWQTVAASGIEHDSVRACVEHRNRHGATCIAIPVDAAGRVDARGLGMSLSQTAAPALVCLQLANSETGVVQSVCEVSEIAHRSGAQLHCDATQGAGRLPIRMATLGADCLVLSAHKMGGPKGAGAVVFAADREIDPMLRGGGQEQRRRAGTENVAAIAGFGAAARAALQDVASVDEVARMRDRLEHAVRAMTPEVMVIGEVAPRLANTSCLMVPGHAAETLVIRFDLAGVSISAGSACSSGKVGRSATLEAMGLSADQSAAAIRVSIGPATTNEEIDHFLRAWRAIVGEGRQHRAVA